MSKIWFPFNFYMVPVFLCLEDVFDLMLWSFIVYYKSRTYSFVNGEKVF